MRYESEKLKSFCTAVMEAAGLNEEESRRFADSLVNADLRGVGSHGVTRLKTYYQRLRDGLVDANAKPEIVSGAPSLLLVDGKNAMGVSSASYAMRECIERAKQTGACFAAVKGGNHFGYAAYFAEQAASAGMIGIAMANGPVAIPPIGGKAPILGTNPLAVVIPAGNALPLELDMATSVVARGKVKLAEKEGKPIPLGWGVDAGGNPTTDPAAVKCVLPFGGAKGFGIGLIIEVLCSCLSGAKNSQTLGSFYDFSGKHQDSGFFVGALNIGAVLPMEQFAASIEALFASIKASPKADGVEEIFIPGEIELRRLEKGRQEGLSIPPAVLKELEELSAETGVPFDCEM